MTVQQQDRKPPPKPKVGEWGWLFEITIVNAFRFIGWSLIAIGVSILVEWIGMIKLWGPEHSREVLELEMTYLSAFNRNMITGVYPTDLASLFVGVAVKIVSFLHLRELNALLAEGVVSGVKQLVIYGVDSVINVIFIFAVRLAICVSAITGFVLVGLVAFVDGLVERDIRKACGGLESAMLYHRAKRLIKPVLIIGFGFYLTAPFTIHPTVMFLPLMALFALVLFIAAKTFKKFL